MSETTIERGVHLPETTWNDLVGEDSRDAKLAGKFVAMSLAKCLATRTSRDALAAMPSQEGSARTKLAEVFLDANLNAQLDAASEELGLNGQEIMRRAALAAAEAHL